MDSQTLSLTMNFPNLMQWGNPSWSIMTWRNLSDEEFRTVLLLRVAFFSSLIGILSSV